MSPARIPWWIWLMAASFIACFAVGFVYLPLKLPQGTGIVFDFPRSRVESVTPGSPGEASGLKPNDTIVNIDGRAIQNVSDAISALSNTTFDHPVSIVVLRRGKNIPLQLTLNRTVTQDRTPKESLGWWVEFAVSLIQFAGGAARCPQAATRPDR